MISFTDKKQNVYFTVDSKLLLDFLSMWYFSSRNVVGSGQEPHCNMGL